MSEQNLSEKDSLHIIHEMIQKVKNEYHESGTSAILWGTVVGFSGLLTFLQLEFNFTLGFDIWLLVLFAIIPQIYISYKEAKIKRVKTYYDAALDYVWMTFGITIFGIIFYANVVPSVSQNIFANDGIELIRHYKNGLKPDEIIKPFPLSLGSIFILIYAFPTIVTGFLQKCKPMLVGGIICYILFVISCFTVMKYDMLLTGIAGIIAWLIPGLILRNKYLKSKKQHV